MALDWREIHLLTRRVATKKTMDWKGCCLARQIAVSPEERGALLQELLDARGAGPCVVHPGKIEGFSDYGLPVNGGALSDEHLVDRLKELGPKYGLTFLDPSPL
jgi:hypothetical protein